MNKRMKKEGKLKKKMNKEGNKKEKCCTPSFPPKKSQAWKLSLGGELNRAAPFVCSPPQQSRRSSSQLAYSRTARDYHHRFPGKSFSPPPDLNHHGIDIATAENHRSQSGKIRSQFLHYQSEKLPKENRFSPHHGLRHTRPTTPKGGAAKCSGTKSSQTSQLWL